MHSLNINVVSKFRRAKTHPKLCYHFEKCLFQILQNPHLLKLKICFVHLCRISDQTSMKLRVPVVSHSSNTDSEVICKKFIYCSTSTCWQIHIFICQVVSYTHSSHPALLTLFSTSSVTRLIFSLVSSVKIFSWFRTKSNLSFWSSRSSIESTLMEQKGNYQ